MVQIHALHRSISAIRPTNDVDIILNVETARGRPAEVVAALESLGYELRAVTDPRSNTAHRFTRGGDTVDVVAADHASPRLLSPIRGHRMVQIEGGTQALRRTIHAQLDITSGRRTVLSVPSAFGALVLKAAAHKADTRNPDRHLTDAVTLLACIDDPFAERSTIAGSDRPRLLHLERVLLVDGAAHPAWFQLSAAERRTAQAALRLLCQIETA